MHIHTLEMCVAIILVVYACNLKMSPLPKLERLHILLFWVADQLVCPFFTVNVNEPQQIG